MDQIIKKDPFVRWEDLRSHLIQFILMNLALYFALNIPRFFVIPSGRRSGKTELAKRRLVMEAVSTRTKWETNYYFAAAPTRPQAKDIYWDDLKALSKPWWSKKPSETELTIYTECDGIKSQIKLFGMEVPERIEGTPKNGGILDEYGNMKPKVFDENVYPALADRNGWCWLIGVPEKGKIHYRKKAFYATDGVLPVSSHNSGSIVRSKEHPEWCYAHWFSSDILPEKTIKEAKDTLDDLTYKQEFEGAFNQEGGSLYYAFHKRYVNDRVAKRDPDEILYLTCDFNKSPMAWLVGQTDTYKKRKRLKYVDHVTVNYDAKTQRAALEFVEKFQGHNNKYVIITGDSSNNHESIRDFTTDYLIIQSTLKAHGWKVMLDVPAGQPNINNRVNITNSLLEHHRLYINSKCALLILDFESNESDNKGGKNKKDLSQTHASDASDYLCWKLFASEFKELGVAL